MKIDPGYCDPLGFLPRTCAHRLLSLFFVLMSNITADSVGLKQIHKDIGPLNLPPSAFTASSVLKNQADYQAHKANLVVFASQEQSSGAWCPSRTVQNQLSEWLQVDFDALKMMRVLFTEGSNQNAFVPAFLLRYQRQDGQRWYDYRMRNGTKLLYANHNSQTIAITLDPPIIARRFRLYPYNELEPRFMCLRIAVYGTPFEDGVVEYAIPEGGVYRLDPRVQISLNDSDYDGAWTPVPSSDQNHVIERRAYFHGGLGLLMDKNFYDGQLGEPEANQNVVGWFRRQYSTPSDRVVMIFTFDQVRNFSRMKIHALNSLDYVALFRRVAVQFSIGGEHFDRLSDPVIVDIPRDTHDRKARWISVELGNRVGRFIRVTLWFDYDWIVLSEVVFESVTVSRPEQFPMEEASDPVRRPTDLDLSDTDSWLLPAAAKKSTSIISETKRQVFPTTAISPSTGAHNSAIRSLSPAESLSESTQTRLSHTPYVIAVLCCCLGLIAFVSLIVFMTYRLRRYRRKQVKKLKPLDNKQQQQQQRHHPQHNGQFGSVGTEPLLHDANFQNALSNSFQYNPLQSSVPGQFTPNSAMKYCMDGSMFSTVDPGFSVSMIPPHALDSGPTDSVNSVAYNQGTHGMDSAQLQTPKSAAIGGATLSRRGGPDAYPCFAPYPFVSLTPNGLMNFANANTGARNFCPPPPDQPLPPLPPPSTSPDSASLLQSITDGTSNNFLAISHVNPYAASYPLGAYTADANMFLPLDGSMPEYASTSLFNNNGTLPNASLMGSINGKSAIFDPETGKYRNPSDTYCVPHQNSVHPCNVWSPGQPLLIPNTQHASNVTLQQAISDSQTGSMDSGGMYYLANNCGGSSLQDTSTGMLVRDCYNPSQTIFLPFSVNGSLLPIPSQDPCEGLKSGVINPMMMINRFTGHQLMSGQSESCGAVNGTDDAADSSVDSTPSRPPQSHVPDSTMDAPSVE